DYSLSPGVFNSYDPTGSIFTTYANWPTNPPPLQGKLTLLSVDFQGKGGESLLSPTEFEYDLDPVHTANQNQINIINVPSGRKGNIYVQTSGKFKAGDIIKFTQNNTLYYCTLLKETTSNTFEVLYLDKQLTATASNVPAFKTKNPPYNKDAYDI